MATWCGPAWSHHAPNMPSEGIWGKKGSKKGYPLLDLGVAKSASNGFHRVSFEHLHFTPFLRM